MFKTHFIKRSDFHFFKPLIHSMLQDRKTVFIDGLQWNALRANHMGWERDEYDTPDRNDAIYVVLEHLDTGRHLASGRLLPTTSSHMLKDHFSQCALNKPYINSETWELSRLCLAPQSDLRKLGINAKQSFGFIDELAIETSNFAYDHNIRFFVGIMDKFVFRYYQKNDFAVEKMGITEEGYIVARWDLQQMQTKRLKLIGDAIPAPKSTSGSDQEDSPSPYNC